MAPGSGALLRWRLAVFVSVPFWATAVDCDADGLALTNEVAGWRSWEAHPSGCKWLITMVIVSPLSRVIPLPNGLKGL